MIGRSHSKLGRLQRTTHFVWRQPRQTRLRQIRDIAAWAREPTLAATDLSGRVGSCWPVGPGPHQGSPEIRNPSYYSHDKIFTNPVKKLMMCGEGGGLYHVLVGRCALRKKCVICIRVLWTTYRRQFLVTWSLRHLTIVIIVISNNNISSLVGTESASRAD